MLRFGLVLLLATSALSAPPGSFEYGTVDLTENWVNAKNIGRANHLTDRLATLRDGGEQSFYTNTLLDVVNDVASLDDRYSQAFAVSNAIASALASSTGVPGDSCAAAEFIEAYTTGNYGQALRNYIGSIISGLDSIANLAKNPQSARFSVGQNGRCRNNGRVYPFEAAWNVILENYDNSLVREQYCTAKRLYNAFDVRHNNVAALTTASSTPAVVKVIDKSLKEIVNLINALSGNGNVNKALGAAKNALRRSL